MQTSGLQFEDPLIPVVPASPVAVSSHTQPTPALVVVRAPLGFVGVLDIITWVLYGGFWLGIAIFSAATAALENEPRYLLLTSTASLNIFLYKLTGETRSELNRQARHVFKKNIPYLVSGAIAAGAVWLGLRFEDPKVMLMGLFITLAAFLFAWAAS